MPSRLTKRNSFQNRRKNEKTFFFPQKGKCFNILYRYFVRCFFQKACSRWRKPRDQWSIKDKGQLAEFVSFDFFIGMRGAPSRRGGRASVERGRAVLSWLRSTIRFVSRNFASSWAETARHTIYTKRRRAKSFTLAKFNICDWPGVTGQIWNVNSSEARYRYLNFYMHFSCVQEAEQEFQALLVL